MSLKERNVYREGFTFNFCEKWLKRIIIIDDQLMKEAEKNEFVRDINEQLYSAIQEVNMRMQGFSLPFVKVYNANLIKEEENVRIVIASPDHFEMADSFENNMVFDTGRISHLIHFKSIFPRRIVQFSDELERGDAKLIIGNNDRQSAAVDICLDIAMFNSISYLTDLPIEEKKRFNLKKIEYAKKHGIGNYYECDKANPPEYWSFAFTARLDYKTIDYDLYIEHWTTFLEEYYPNEKHSNRYPNEQLKLHTDINNLPQDMLSPNYWERFDKGAYLVLRINKEPNTNERKRMLCRFFGITDFHIGAIKVVPLNSYFEPFLKRMLQELYVSAFKIVID